MNDARTVTIALRGRWYQSYGLAFCPAHLNGRTPALSLADAEDGRLLAKCHAGCSFQDVAAAIRALGVETGGRLEFDPVDIARRKAEAEAQDAKRRAQAQRCWAEARPATGTLAERYLRARGYRGRVPATLRFHPDCWHNSALRFPAMVGVVERAAEVVGVHRTYLAEPNAKADIDPVKMMLGGVMGGALRLSCGSGPLVVAEGVETSLAVLDALRDVSPRVWAGLSAAGMAGLSLPTNPGELVIAPDSGVAGTGAADALARRAHDHGWSVRIMEPPQVGDWADVALEKSGASGGQAA